MFNGVSVAGRLRSDKKLRKRSERSCSRGVAHLACSIKQKLKNNGRRIERRRGSVKLNDELNLYNT